MQNNKLIKTIFNYLLLVFGTVLLSFSCVTFLSPLEINSGGINGISIIVSHFFDDTSRAIAYNITSAFLQVILWIIGLIFVGKNFAYKSLISTIVYPIANALFTLVPGTSDFINRIVNVIAIESDIGSIVFCSVLGGIGIGLSTALTYLSGGSSGGIDTITFMLEKYLNIKQSIGTLIQDFLILGVGMIILCINNLELYLLPCLCGLLSALLTSIVIDKVYISFQDCYQVDIISKHYEDISSYVQNELKRGATLIPAKGGYKHTDKIVLRVILSRSEYDYLMKFIALTDDKAFLTVTKVKAVFGEGFKTNKRIKH